MNLILLDESDYVDDTTVRLEGRRLAHVRTVHRATEGDSLRVGLIGGRMGTGLISRLTDSSLEMRIALDQTPPEPLDVQLFLALPRPKFLAKCLQTATSLGVKKIWLFNAYKVEKIYWSCAQLTEPEVREACLLGLEQARDTLLPTVETRRLFKPFVEDEMPGLLKGTRALLAHPGGSTHFPSRVDGPVSLVIGPEGGFIDYEVEKLVAAGCETVSVGERILKVETAVAALLGRLL